MYNEFEIMMYFLPKILVSTICGAIVGYDREVRNKVAGIRTNVLIAVGVTILTTVSFWISKDNANIDPTRIIGQIVTGIGFLGAGVIMKHDDKIIGVTTAAFIWVVSAIGVMIGLFACSVQQYLSHFVSNAKLMLRHYEPPTNFNEAKIFVQ
jgi:putative Mg2+ transporter-C (MgtC) family protein